MGFVSILTGSFSTPADDNPTVAVVEAAYRHHGLDARYLNCEVAPADLADAVRGALAMGWAGFNCSLPHKVAVVEHLHALAPSAAVIGAVNCVVRDGDRWVGENTDGQGFLASLREVVNPAGRSVVVLGAGGAARAVAVEVALDGARSVTVVNRSAARGRELVDLLSSRTPAQAALVGWDSTFAVPADTDVLVNATSIGLAPDVGAVPDLDLDTLRPGLVVADVVASPPRTALLREAAERGATTLDGLGMLVNQAVLGIRLWTGLDPDPAVMRQVLDDLAAGTAQPGPGGR